MRSKSDLQILRTSIGARARPPHGPRGMQHASRDHHAIARACMVSAPPGDAWSPTRGGCRGGGSPVLVRYVCPSFCFRFQYMTRGWGLRPGGVLVGSLTCCRSYSCGGGRAPPGGQGGRGGGTAGRARVVGLAALTAAAGAGWQKGTTGWQQQESGGSSRVAEAGAGWQHPGGRLAAEQPGGSRAAWWQQSCLVAAEQPGGSRAAAG